LLGCGVERLAVLVCDLKAFELAATYVLRFPLTVALLRLNACLALDPELAEVVNIKANGREVRLIHGPTPSPRVRHAKKIEPDADARIVDNTST
jgi:hypothetical protein